MMKIFTKIFAVFIAALLLFTSCDGDNLVVQQTVVITGGGLNPTSYTVPTNDDGEFAITFGGYSPATRALADGGTSTLGYDDFNLFVWNSLGEDVMNPYLVEATGEGAYDYSQLDGQELKYFKNNTTNYEFIGVIPTTLEVSKSDDVVSAKSVEAFVVDDNRVTGTLTEDSPKEFLWSYKKVEKASYGTRPVELPFNHGNALLYIGFSSDREDTEILDYVPSSEGYKVYTATARPTPVLGPLVGVITDEDIEYINSRYESSLGWLSYFSTNSTFTGDLSQNMWDYLLSKHSDLENENLQNWASYVSNSNMRLVHIEKDGQTTTTNDSYRGWFINVVNVNWEEYTEGESDGIPGVRVFSAKADADEGFVHESHVETATALVSSNGLSWDDLTSSTDVIEFSLPETTTFGSVQWSPSTYYSIPANSDITHFVVKFSYTYNGVIVYDVRVPLELPSEGLVSGKYYKYEIKITSTGNGVSDPSDATDGKDDIDIVDNPIIVTITLTDNGYTEGVNKQVEI